MSAHQHRRPRGEEQPAHKLTDDRVRSIRRARRAGASVRELARDHNVSHQLVSMVARRLRWKHVADRKEIAA